MQEDHSRFIDGKQRVRISELKNGDIVEFNYNGKPRQILILEANADGLLHGLNIEEMSRVGIIQIKSMLKNTTSKALYETYIKNQAKLKKENLYKKFFLDQLGAVDKIQYRDTMSTVNNSIKTRNYTSEELIQELDEFFDNEFWKGSTIFKTRDELKNRIINAKEQILPLKELFYLKNSDMKKFVESTNKKDFAIRTLTAYGKDWKAIQTALDKSLPLPPPIIIRKGRDITLLAGNTRLLMAYANNLEIPCKIIDL